jgi:lysophospholipase L1-like esterase
MADRAMATWPGGDVMDQDVLGRGSQSMLGASQSAGGASPARRLNRMTGGRVIVMTILVVLLILALTGIDLVAFALRGTPFPSQQHYYLSLGDSLAYGYQPDFNFTAGFSDDLFADLRTASRATEVVNYSCGGESTTTMIQGNCTGHVLKHDFYPGAQLDAAVNFLRNHVGAVGPVTLDMGANDVIADWDATTCQANANANADLATLDTNLTKTILPRLVAALHPPAGVRAGSFVMLNYYNPFAKECSNSGPFIHTLNNHLATDAAQFRIPVVDVYAAFGGDDHQADNTCAYTWMCSGFKDIHPTTQGYRIIASAIENVLTITDTDPGVNPPPIIATPPMIITPSAGTPASGD